MAVHASLMRWMAGQRAWSVRVLAVTLVCCAVVASAAPHTVDPEAELPLVEGPAEFQVRNTAETGPDCFTTPARWPVPSTERASYLGVLGRVWQDGVKAADCTALVLQVLELRTFTPEQQQRFFHEARLALNVTDVGNEAVTFASYYDLKHWWPTGRNLGW